MIELEFSVHAQLEALVSDGDPFMRGFVDAAKAGRTYLPMRLWGLIEENLTNLLLLTWMKLLADPFLDIEPALHEQFIPLARRLNLSLSN